VVKVTITFAESAYTSWPLWEITVLGRHANRARLYNINGTFLTTLPVSEVERMVDSGVGIYMGHPEERPLRVKLLCARQWQPKPLSPTSGCTSPSCITHKEIEAYAGIHGQPRMIAARKKLEAAFPDFKRSKTWK